MLPDSTKIGVVITTYNSPAWLEKVFWGYANQSDNNFELIVADDGSADETKTLIQHYQSELSFPIHHVWHEDEGFRKTIILNKVIAQTTASYLIFTDGDCIPAPDFITVHRNKAEQGRFLSGGYYKLAMQPSKEIAQVDINSERAFDFSWLHKLGQPKNFKRSKLSKNQKLRWLLERITPTKASWNGMNSSAFTSDIVSVNGFDERMQYGGLDRELGERLENKGIRGKQIRYSAICLHLDHARGYSNPETWKKNRQIRADVKQTRSAWTDYGITKSGSARSPSSATTSHS